MSGKIVRWHGMMILGIGRENGELLWRPLMIRICTNDTFFLFAEDNNDLNVLDRSPLIHNMLTSEASNFTFNVNEKKYNRYYLLADGIYP